MSWQDRIYKSLINEEEEEGKKPKKKTTKKKTTKKKASKKKATKKPVTQIWADDPMDPKYDQWHNSRTGPGEAGGFGPKGRGN